MIDLMLMRSVERRERAKIVYISTYMYCMQVAFVIRVLWIMYEYETTSTLQ
jgi:hypothetical protein